MTCHEKLTKSFGTFYPVDEAALKLGSVLRLNLTKTEEWSNAMVESSVRSSRFEHAVKKLRLLARHRYRLVSVGIHQPRYTFERVDVGGEHQVAMFLRILAPL